MSSSPAGREGAIEALREALVGPLGKKVTTLSMSRLLRALLASGHLHLADECPAGRLRQVGWNGTHGFPGRSEPGQNYLHGHISDQLGGAGADHEDCVPVYVLDPPHHEEGPQPGGNDG